MTDMLYLNCICKCRPGENQWTCLNKYFINHEMLIVSSEEFHTRLLPAHYNELYVWGGVNWRDATSHIFLYPSAGTTIQTLTHTPGYEPPALRLIRASHCSISVITCFVLLSEQTAVTFLRSFDWLIYQSETNFQSLYLLLLSVTKM